MTSDNTKKKKAKHGEGSVYQLANGKWVGKLYLGRKSDGKPNRKTFSGRTEAEVRRKIREFNKEKDKFLSENIAKLSVEEYFLKWLYTYKIHKLKESSFDRLESTIKTHIIPYLGMSQMGNDLTEDCQNLINEMYNKGYAHSTIKKVYDALNACFKYAVAKRDLTHNSMDAVAMISIKKFKKKEQRFFTDEEIEAFEEEATRKYKTGRDIYKHGYTFILMLNTGIRQSEALAIDKNRDIDLKDNLLYIRNNVAVVKERDKDDPSKIIGRETIIQDTTKTDAGTNRIIPLNDKAIKAVKYILDNYSIESSNFLISNDKGEALSPTVLSKSFDKILKGAKIEQCGTHTLRHTFASKLFEKDEDVKVISEILGHANVGITYDTYIHLINKQKAKAIKAINF